MKKEYNEIYIVGENETIDSIAKKFDRSPISILIANNIAPKMVVKGKVLFIKRKVD